MNEPCYEARYSVTYGGIDDAGETRRTTTLQVTCIRASDDAYAIKAALYQGEEFSRAFLPTPEGTVTVELTNLVRAGSHSKDVDLTLPEQRTFVGQGRPNLGIEERALRGTMPNDPYRRELIMRRRAREKPAILQSIEDLELLQV